MYVRLKVGVYLCRVVVGYKEKTRRSVRWIKQQRKNKPVFSSVRFAAGAKKCKKRSNSWNSFLSVFFHLNSLAYIFKTNLKKTKSIPPCLSIQCKHKIHTKRHRLKDREDLVIAKKKTIIALERWISVMRVVKNAYNATNMLPSKRRKNW